MTGFRQELEGGSLAGRIRVGDLPERVVLELARLTLVLRDILERLPHREAFERTFVRQVDDVLAAAAGDSNEENGRRPG